MNPRQEQPNHMSSPCHSTSGGNRSPPPEFQEHDPISTFESSPELYTPHPHPPSDVSSSLQQCEHAPPQEYREGYFSDPFSTLKPSPYATHTTVDITTPDFSVPEVVPGQHQSHANRDPTFFHSSHGASAVVSPYMVSRGFKDHVDAHDSVDPYDSASRPGYTPPVSQGKQDRRCGMKKWTCWILFGCILVLLIFVGVGLGVGLTFGLGKKIIAKKTYMDPFCVTYPTLCIGGALSSEYFSKSGAFNGSGIALAGESWNEETRRLFTLYFQHHSGRIRYMQYTKDQQWIGGTEKEIVATDAKDATPISAVSYALNYTQYFHVFYVSKNNTIRQTTLTNLTTTWQPGPLNDLNLQVHDSPSIGLQACWKGDGDSDYTKFPTSTDQDTAAANTSFKNPVGMNIWYALDNATFQQYAWYDGNTVWQKIREWPGFSTQAGVGCYSWGPGTTQYAMLVSKKNDVEIWWKDSNRSLAATASDQHPINSWQKNSEVIPGVHPASSLGYTTFFYAQAQDRSIRGYNISWAAENTTFSSEETFTVKSPTEPLLGLGATHLTVTAVAGDLYVFFQTAGNDITAATRRVEGGEWTIGSLTIPDD